MLGIMMAYWRDARIQTAKGRDMLYSTGMKRTLYDRVLDALEKMADKPTDKRAARWTRSGGSAAARMTPNARASAGEGRGPCQSWRQASCMVVSNAGSAAARMTQ